MIVSLSHSSSQDPMSGRGMHNSATPEVHFAIKVDIFHNNNTGATLCRYCGYFTDLWQLQPLVWDKSSSHIFQLEEWPRYMLVIFSKLSLNINHPLTCQVTSLPTSRRTLTQSVFVFGSAITRSGKDWWQQRASSQSDEKKIFDYAVNSCSFIHHVNLLEYFIFW